MILENKFIFKNRTLLEAQIIIIIISQQKQSDEKISYQNSIVIFFQNKKSYLIYSDIIGFISIDTRDSKTKIILTSKSPFMNC